MSDQANSLALLRKDTVEVVADRVRALQESRQLHLPANYSAENAMKSAWLILQSTLDKDKRPALQVCSRDSIANSLLDMVVQGLNPAKKQGYFIVYGNQLVFQRSYFGTMAVAKRVAGVDVFAQVVYGGDEFEYAIERGRKRVVQHVQRIENVRGDNITAAYCTLSWPDGREQTEIMTWDQIQRAWTKSRQNPNSEGSVHRTFPDQMVLKTVINRTCKPVINASSDDHLFLTHFNRTDEEVAEIEFAEEAAEQANGEVIDVEPPVAPAPAQQPATPPTQPQQAAAPTKPGGAQEPRTSGRQPQRQQTLAGVGEAAVTAPAAPGPGF